jgi:hypothetical protein
METNQAQTECTQEEMNTLMDIHQEKMEAAIHSLRAWREEMMVCQGTMEACLECKELTSEDMESEAEHREVP